jgi:hypothetical protein
VDVAGAEVAGAVVGGVGANTPRLTPHPGLAPPWVSDMSPFSTAPLPWSAGLAPGLLLLMICSTGRRGMWGERGLTRIGVSAATDWPYRFYVVGASGLSRYPGGAIPSSGASRHSGGAAPSSRRF